jgi:hypothetical protein
VDASVFQELGEGLTRSLLTRDFDLYRQVMNLPIRIEPRGGSAYTLETPDALRTDFDLYCDHIKLHGITDIYREALEIDRLDDDTAAVTCMINILRGATRIVRPFRSVMTMRRGADDTVRFAKIQSALGHINWTLGQGGISNDSFD